MFRASLGVMLAVGVSLVSVSPLSAQKRITYVPPKQERERPQQTQSSATRGCRQELTDAVTLLAPADHVGLTVSPRPALFYYLSRPIEVPALITLAARDGRSALWEREVNLEHPGLHRFQLPPTVELESGQEYLWSITLLCNRVRLSAGVEVQVALRRVPPPPALARQLAAVPLGERSRLYALAGLWYEALADVVGRQPPASPDLRDLLAQIGLTDLTVRLSPHENTKGFSR